jgi:1-deoxy-D-xylulose-5-phosphate synthase
MLVHMLHTALRHDAGPVAIRYPRGEAVGVPIPDVPRTIEIGTGEILREGERVAVVGYGTGVRQALGAAELLAERGLDVTVADARFAKPLDVELLMRLVREHEVLVTIEEGSIGGFGSYVLQTLAENGALENGLRVRTMVLPDLFFDQDTPAAMYAKAGLDAKGIVTKVFEALGKDAAEETVKLA